MLLLPSVRSLGEEEEEDDEEGEKGTRVFLTYSIVKQTPERMEPFRQQELFTSLEHQENDHRHPCCQNGVIAEPFCGAAVDSYAIYDEKHWHCAQEPAMESVQAPLPPPPRKSEVAAVSPAKLSREEKRRRRRASLKYRRAHATRERLRVEAFNRAFLNLRQLLPTLPPDKKLSKIEILRLSVCYITYLGNMLQHREK